MQKKILSIVLALCMLLSTMVAVGVPAFAAGDVTEIGTYDALVTWAANPTTDAKLTADIVANEGKNPTTLPKEYETTDNTAFLTALSAAVAEYECWTSITSFAGTFDGNGKTITGLCMTSADGSGRGAFFSALADGAVVKNVTFENCYAKERHNQGAIVAATSAGSVTLTNVDLKNCRVDAEAGGEGGGLIAKSSGAVTLTSCDVTGGTVTAYPEKNAAGAADMRVGAFVGEAAAAITAINCTNGAAVVGQRETGGLIGKAGSTVNITGSTNTGNVTFNNTAQSANPFVGGFVGYASSGKVTVSNSTNSGNVSLTAGGTNGVAGGLIGIADKGVDISGATNSGTITNTTGYAAGLVGKNQNASSSIKASSNSGNVTGSTTAAGVLGLMNGGYQLTAENISNSGKVTSGSSWGGGLIGLFYNGTGTSTVKLGVNSGEVTCTGSQKVGGLIGYVHGSLTVKLDSCVNETTGVVTGTRFGAGMVSVVESGTLVVDNSVNKAPITGPEYAGGFVAQAYNAAKIAISNSTNSGNCVSTKTHSTTMYGAGGFIGIVQNNSNTVVTIQNCVNSGNASGYEAGGMIGVLYASATITNCVNSGAMTGKDFASGLVALSSGSISASTSVNNGTIKSNHAGGLFGKSTAPVTAENCLNAGDVEATSRGAGFAAILNTTASSFKNSLMLGNVKGSASLTAAFVADVNTANTTTPENGDEYQCIKIENCYYVAGLVKDTAIRNYGVTQSNLDQAAKKTGNFRLVYGDTTVDMVGGVYNATTTWSDAVKALNVPFTEGTVPAMLNSADALTGVAGLKFLQKAGFDFSVWKLNNANNMPVPTALAISGEKATPDASLAISYKGYQVSNDGNAIRFIAGMDTIEGYNATGFDMIVTTAQGDSAPAEPLTTKTVYQSLSAGDQIGAIKASDLGCTYLSALTFNNVPADCIITLTATLTPAEGEIVSGTTVVIVVENGAVVAQYAI
ncbi:MAG: hypothetical protein E7668_05765 [Ruminococcaceae bacterium]|nr:hypothetical protein [Oscillospiraceae bacterium]